MPTTHIHFVTGRLAANALERVLERLSTEAAFAYSIDVLPITVAALMTPQWIAERITVPKTADKVLVPGYCSGDLLPIKATAGVPVDRGPRDLLALADYFGQATDREGYGEYDIEIIAEINHASRLTRAEILTQARDLARDGADMIDVGCDPGEPWAGIADCVTALRDQGHRVSIDSWNVDEVSAAVRAGAELVLSVNGQNCVAARDWGCEVVLIPDAIGTLDGLDAAVERLISDGISFRIDPVLEPIGCGFAASLQRYWTVRDRYADHEIMMGIGNLTELTDVDSAGVNVILMGLCQELGIRSVLTTQVINWAGSSVAECDLARRLVHYAVTRQAVPKNLETGLIALRDPRLYPQGFAAIEDLARTIRDHNYRIFADAGELHIVSDELHLHGDDAFLLFEELSKYRPGKIDASHAFYLGYEMSKAVTALTLSKQYRQDEALDWGYLTAKEESHRLRRSAKARGNHDETTESNQLDADEVE